jgi:hypothetical protein
VKINRQLVWDYPPDLPEADEGFRRWYVARVLTRGGIEDVHALGLETIREYLPKVVIPPGIRGFWEWYFGSKGPDGDPDRGATKRP